MKKSIVFFAFTLVFVGLTMVTEASPLREAGKLKKAKQKEVELDLNQYYEDPTPSLPADYELQSEVVKIKVLSLKGELVLETEVKTDVFFSNQNSLNILPTHSLFVLFQNNTAYYILETEN